MDGPAATCLDTTRQEERAVFGTSSASPHRLERTARWEKGGVLGLLGAWIERWRQRRALAALDDHLLRDLGITREEAERESAKPFWRR
jgi:uncharacterized protein YjiS (DUF1127 family)